MKKIFIMGILIIGLLLIGVFAFDYLKVNVDEQKSGQQEIMGGKLVYEIVSVDQDQMIIELTNQTDEEIVLNYMSSQKYNFNLIKNGKSIYNWAADKSFLQVITQVALKPEESEKYIIDLTDLPIKSGEYEIEFFSVAKELENTPALKDKLTIE